MSTCISGHGEWSDHTPDAEYTCTRCGVLDEPGLTAELRRLREELDEARAEIDERNEWADSLASALDVPGDLDPFFGIDRMAREQVRFLREADAEIKQLREDLVAEQEEHQRSIRMSW